MPRRALVVALCAACGGGQHATTAPAPAPVRATVDAAAFDAAPADAGTDGALEASDDAAADASAAHAAWRAKIDALPFTQHGIFAPQPVRPRFASARQPFSADFTPAVAQILSIRSSDGVTPERLHMFVARRGLELARCVPLTKDAKPAVQKAEVKVRFGIDAAGAAVDVEAEPPSDTPEIAACVLRVFEHASFVAPPVSLVAVEMVIRLDARPVIVVPEHTRPGAGAH